MSQTWSHRPDVAWIGDEDRVVALALGRADARPLAFDARASRLWLRLAVPTPLADLVDELADGHEPSEVEEGLRRFLEQLQEGGLLEHGTRDA